METPAGEPMILTLSYSKQCAMGGCLLLAGQILYAASDRVIRYDIKTQVFCLERPASISGAEKSWGYCETGVPLSTSGAFFHSGELIHIRIQNGHLTSSYTITVDDSKKITADGPQFRPQTPLSLAAPAAQGGNAAEAVKYLGLDMTLLQPANTGEPGKQTVANYVGSLTDPAGIEQTRIGVRSSAAALRNAADKIDRDWEDLRLAVGQFRGTAASCDDAALGPQMARITKMAECRFGELDAPALSSNPNEFAKASQSVSELTEHAAVFSGLLDKVQFAKDAVNIRAEANALRDSMLEFASNLDQIEAAIGIVRALRASADSDFDRQVQLAMARAQLKELLPSASDDDIKALVASLQKKLDASATQFHDAVVSELDAIGKRQQALGHTVGTEDLAADIGRMRDQLKKQLESGGATFRDIADTVAAIQFRLSTSPVQNGDVQEIKASAARTAQLIEGRRAEAPTVEASLVRLEEEIRKDRAGLPELSRDSIATEADRLINRFNADVAYLQQAIQKVFDRINTLWRDSQRGEYYDVLGQWSDNRFVKVTVSEDLNYVPFKFSGPGPGSQGADVKKGEDGAIAQPQGANQAKARTATAVFTVHMIVGWKVIAGFTASTLRTLDYDTRDRTQVDASGNPVKDSSGNPVKEKFIIRTQDDKQLHYLLGPAIYLKKRDLFPGATTNGDRLWPAIMLGVALDQTNNYYLGPTWEPITGLDIDMGFHLGQEKLPQRGLFVGSTLPASLSTTPTRSSWRGGVFVGVGFDINIFRNIFAKPTGQGSNLP